MREDAAAFGIDPETLPEQEPDADEGFLVYPENWTALNVFLSLSTTWTMLLPAMGGKPLFRGIPRTEIAATLQLMGLWRERAEILPRVLVMESAAMEQLNAEST